MTETILIVDDEIEMARGLGDYLDSHGYQATCVDHAEAALECLRQNTFSAVISDLKMPGTDGLELLKQVQVVAPHLPFFIMTGFGTFETAVEAVKQGAYHYFPKPLKTDEVLIYLERAIEHRELMSSKDRLQQELEDKYTFESMVGRAPVMRRIFDTIERAADSDASVLILGESGTGKELIARALHYRSERRERPFVPVNCAAIPGSLLESELFGHEKGSFTGASRARPGLVVESASGTLFLDEVGDLPLEVQPKLLRLLQEGEVRAVGSDQVFTVDVRLVAATNVDLKKKVEAGTFRQDLFYRLNVVPIEVPPLRARAEDIPLLVDRLIAKMRDRNSRLVVERVSDTALAALMRYDWPGNVRELENAIERAATMSKSVALGEDDFAFLKVGEGIAPSMGTEEGFVSLKEMERRYMQRVLEHVGGNRTKASAILGIDPSTLYRKSKRP